MSKGIQPYLTFAEVDARFFTPTQDIKERQELFYELQIAHILSERFRLSSLKKHTPRLTRLQHRNQVIENTRQTLETLSADYALLLGHNE